MKYNKFQLQDVSSQECGSLVNHTGNCRGPDRCPIPHSAEAAADKSPLHAAQTLESEVRDIRRSLRQILSRIQNKVKVASYLLRDFLLQEERSRMALEWRIVALVLDR